MLVRRRVGDVCAVPQPVDADLAEFRGGRVGVEALPRVEGHRGRREEVERVLGLGGRRGSSGIGSSGTTSSGSGGSSRSGSSSLGRLGGLFRRRRVVDGRLVRERHLAQHLGERRLVHQRVEPARHVGDGGAVSSIKELGEAEPEVARADDVGERDGVADEEGARGEHRVERRQRLLPGGLRGGLLLLGVGPDACDGEVPGEQRGVDLARAPVDFFMMFWFWGEREREREKRE